MDIARFENTFEMAEVIGDAVSNNLEVTIVGKYTVIESLLRSLSAYDTAYRMIDISLYDDDEESDWVLEIDSEWGLYLYRFENGVNIVADIIFIHSDYSNVVIKACNIEDEDDIIEFVVTEFEDECDGDCEHCSLHADEDGYVTELSRTDDGELHGFTRSRSEGDSYYSESFYSTNPELVRMQLSKYNY